MAGEGLKCRVQCLCALLMNRHGQDVSAEDIIVLLRECRWTVPCRWQGCWGDGVGELVGVASAVVTNVPCVRVGLK